MINTIIFDLGGVLLDLDMQRCIKEFEALGLDVKFWFTNESTDDSTKGTLSKGMVASKMMDLYQTGQVSTETFLGDALKRCRKETTWEEVVAAWNSLLICIPTEKLNMLKQLRKEGYKVYMLSNTNEEHWRYLEKNIFPESVMNYFDGIYMSQLLGMAKPDIRVFEYVLMDIGTEAEECLYIDDTSANCEAAASMGLHTINVEPNTRWDEKTIRMYLD